VTEILAIVLAAAVIAIAIILVLNASAEPLRPGTPVAPAEPRDAPTALDAVRSSRPKWALPLKIDVNVTVKRVFKAPDKATADAVAARERLKGMNADVSEADGKWLVTVTKAESYKADS
jgi:hypothetical protein